MSNVAVKAYNDFGILGFIVVFIISALIYNLGNVSFLPSDYSSSYFCPEKKQRLENWRNIFGWFYGSSVLITIFCTLISAYCTSKGIIEEENGVTNILIFLALLLGFVSLVPYYFFIVRCWEEIPSSGSDISPQVRAGLSFIPLFHLIWPFFVFCGLIDRMNNFIINQKKQNNIIINQKKQDKEYGYLVKSANELCGFSFVFPVIVCTLWIISFFVPFICTSTDVIGVIEICDLFLTLGFMFYIQAKVEEFIDFKEVIARESANPTHLVQSKNETISQPIIVSSNQGTFCPKCGFNTGNDRFCRQCGTKLQ
jgi:hypothetical protein